MKLFTAWNFRYCPSQSVKMSCSENRFYNRNIQDRAQSVKNACSEITCNLKSVKLSCSESSMKYRSI